MQFKKQETNMQSIREMWNTIKHTNINIMGVLKQRRIKKDQKKILEIMTHNF